MEYVIAAIILIMILLIIGIFTRKKHYKEIDKLEAMKLELMNRPVLDELMKVKELNMTGETEVLFEGWRKAWDDIIVEKLPNVDELLFDAEEYTVKYRFSKAKATQLLIASVLEEISKQIDQIMEELHDLIGSEEKNRIEVDELKTTFQEIKKHLLSYRHQYGVAAEQFEKELETVFALFQDFDELTSQGNYLKAREIVLSLHKSAQMFQEKLDKLPELLTECEHILPHLCTEIEEGSKEMEQLGFQLDHLNLEKELTQVRDKIDTYMEILAKAEIGEVEDGIQEIKEEIDLLYDLLEQEVHSKHYITKNKEVIESRLAGLKLANAEIQTEAHFVQKSYHLSVKEMEIPPNIEKALSQLTKRFEVVAIKIKEDKSAYSYLGGELKEIEETLVKMQEEQVKFSEHLQNLRKDEILAWEATASLNRQLIEISRLVEKSHVPGLPNEYESLFQLAEAHIEDLVKSLEEVPLNMKQVQTLLQQSQDSAAHLYVKTEELIENIMLVEKVIQYGNRYRRTHHSVAERLNAAEQSFRSFDYRLALEQAATAVEEVEPGALSRIEAIVNEEMEKIK